MKRKGNTAWRSRNGQMIKARQIRLLHGTVMLDYYLRKTMRENVDQSYILFNKIFCKVKQKVSNILLLMFSAQFIKFKRLAISVKRSSFKKAYLPMFCKARRPKTSALSSFSLRYFPAILSQNIQQYNSRNLQLKLFGPTSPTKKGQSGQRTFGGLPLLAPIDFGAMDFMLLVILE